MLKFLVECMTGQSLQLFRLNDSFLLASAFKRLRSAIFSTSWIAVLLTAPQIVLRPMFCTLSSLLLLFLRQHSKLWRGTQQLVLQPLCGPVPGCRSWPEGGSYKFLHNGQFYSSLGFNCFKMWLPRPTSIDGYPQETLASQPVELAGCLILVRPPMQWIVWRLCIPS